jgi:hypothetical protein
MIPAGFMAKRVSPRPEWLAAEQVVDIYSVSGCISEAFADFIPHWKHNGYWLFDTPEVIRQLARETAIDLQETSLFYYEVYEHEFDEIAEAWREFEPQPFPTQVVVPPERVLAGYDVVSFTVGTSAECSPLSCANLAQEVETNEHCLLASFEQAHELLERGRFNDTEPGPFRVFAVYSVAWS